ncbi:putative regulatory protein, FmdB family [Sanguibacter gelidistatuariae]|uniref:Putative regulatory protein, FmdB family n=1 Tax=Sanguibacter gelidistatuariae TaxID=1814289 RepID=A0A1G6Q452_9MICO|nr:FmdB family zinc ribbon protein [Sanguibacter gelidistatuariae]SDC87021.1 putative regulatory protein, FmdB family [Sanguibacter gelidistatuariae]
MPLYAYTCTACGHNFDIHQSFADDSLTVCPECDGLLRKVFSPVGVVFKGSGFYRTDNKAASKSKVPASTKASESSSSAKESTAAPASSGSTPSSAPASASSSSSSSSSASSSSAAPAAAK